MTVSLCTQAVLLLGGTPEPDPRELAAAAEAAAAEAAAGGGSETASQARPSAEMPRCTLPIIYPPE